MNFKDIQVYNIYFYVAYVAAPAKDKKYGKNWTKETVFVYILGFIFYGVSHAKTDLALNTCMENRLVSPNKITDVLEIWLYSTICPYTVKT